MADISAPSLAQRVVWGSLVENAGPSARPVTVVDSTVAEQGEVPEGERTTA
jgi:hypothetical protein